MELGVMKGICDEKGEVGLGMVEVHWREVWIQRGSGHIARIPHAALKDIADVSSPLIVQRPSRKYLFER